MEPLPGGEYLVRTAEMPRLKKRATVRDTDGDPVFRVTREGFTGPIWFTFSDPDGTPVFHVETSMSSFGRIKYTTRRYPIVEDGADDPLAVVVYRWVGPGKWRFDIESHTGSRLATASSRSRLRGLVRAIPFGGLLVKPLTYDVITPEGAKVAALLDRPKVMGREFTVLIPQSDSVPWPAVFAVAVLHGRAGFAQRLP